MSLLGSRRARGGFADWLADRPCGCGSTTTGLAHAIFGCPLGKLWERRCTLAGMLDGCKGTVNHTQIDITMAALRNNTAPEDGPDLVRATRCVLALFESPTEDALSSKAGKGSTVKAASRLLAEISRTAESEIGRARSDWEARGLMREALGALLGDRLAADAAGVLAPARGERHRIRAELALAVQAGADLVGLMSGDAAAIAAAGPGARQAGARAKCRRARLASTLLDALGDEIDTPYVATGTKAAKRERAQHDRAERRRCKEESAQTRRKERAAAALQRANDEIHNATYIKARARRARRMAAGRKAAAKRRQEERRVACDRDELTRRRAAAPRVSDSTRPAWSEGPLLPGESRETRRKCSVAFSSASYEVQGRGLSRMSRAQAIFTRASILASVTR